MTRSSGKRVLKILALGLLYAGTGRLGLMLGPVSGFASLVWPPTGIALAALLLCCGRSLWPGVALGAFATNIWNGAPLAVAGGIAVGNTLEACLAAWALERCVGFTSSIDRVRDALGLIVLAAVLSTMVSATVGVGSLLLGGLVTPAGLAATWQAWWMGDLVGDLVLAPLLLVWATPGALARPQARQAVEALAVGPAVALAACFIFGTPHHVASAFRRPHLIFPILVWAVLRFGQRGGVTTTFLVSGIAVAGVLHGVGPFAEGTLSERLLAGSSPSRSSWRPPR